MDNSATPCVTTAANADPKNVFNMTGWNEKKPGAYIRGIRISAQKQSPQNDTIAMLDSVKLIEIRAMPDLVDDAINALSMDSLTDTPNNVKNILKLLPKAMHGAQITWSSSNEDLINNDGKLIGDPAFDTDVIMTAKITNPQDQFTKYMDFCLKVRPRSSFLESYPGSVTGTPSSAGSEGTKTFEQLPMWNFSYPGISNGSGGEVHTGQVLIDNGYLTFQKISNRQTINYNDCVVGTRSLSNQKEKPTLKSVDVSFIAKVHGTGTMRFAPLTVDGIPALTLQLDASAKAIDLIYGEQQASGVAKVKQRIAVDPTIEHTYELSMTGDDTFVFKIDGNVIETPSPAQARYIVPKAMQNPIFSQITALPQDIFQGILCRLQFLAKQNGNTTIEIYEGREVE